MRSQPTDRPFQVVLIALFQFLKAGLLLGVAALLWLAPDALPHSETFTRVLYVAAHGKDLSGVLVPVFGFYMAYVAYGLWMMWPSTRQTLAISSVITTLVSLNHLGVFSDGGITNYLDRETLYILILLDVAMYIYLVFHPEVTRTFERSGRRVPPLHS